MIQLVISAVVLAAVLLVAFLPRSAWRRKQALETASRESGLALEPAIEGYVLRRSQRAKRYAVIGGLVVMIVLLWAPFATTYESHSMWLTFGAIAVGGGLGNAVAAFVDARVERLPDLPRFARSRAVVLTDYVSKWELRFGWIGAAVTIVGATWCALTCVRDPYVVIGVPAVTAVSAIAAHGVGRLIVARPQHATDTLELAWDDALRAKNLTAIFSAAPLVASYGIAAMTLALWPRWEFVEVLAFAPIFGVVILLTGSNDHANRYYLRRLWPETAAELETNERLSL